MCMRLVALGCRGDVRRGRVGIGREKKDTCKGHPRVTRGPGLLYPAAAETTRGRSEMAEEEVGIVGQTAPNMLMGERRSFDVLGSSCSGACGAPLSQEGRAVVEDGAARNEDGGASQAMGRAGKPPRSPNTAPGSRRRRRDERTVHARNATADGRQTRRRGALFGGEGDTAEDDGSRASARMQCDAPQRSGRADDGLGHRAALASATGAVAAEAISVGGGPTGAQTGVTADTVPAAAHACDQESLSYVLLRAAESRRVAHASQSRAMAQIVSGAGALVKLAQDLASDGQSNDARAALGALAELHQGVDEMAFTRQAIDAAVSDYQEFGTEFMHVMLQAVQAGTPGPRADVATCLPEWLAQAALLQAADTDADTAVVTHAASPDGAARRARARRLGWLRRQSQAVVRLQAGVRRAIARRCVASLREQARRVALVAARASARREGAHLLRERQARAATRLQVFARLGTRRLRNRRMDGAIAIALTRLRALTCLQAVVRRCAAQRARAAAAEATAAAAAEAAAVAEDRAAAAAEAGAAAAAAAAAEAEAAEAETARVEGSQAPEGLGRHWAAEWAGEDGMEEGLGDHWLAVAQAQRQLAALMQVDPLSMMSQVEHNLAATRLRWATARAAEAGRTAQVAQATEPPIATDAPT